MKRLIWCVLLTLLFTTSVAAASSGTCGDNATWTIEDHTLTISGTGKIDDRLYSTWSSLSNSIQTIKIEEGITAIGMYSFSGLTYVASVSLPSTLKEIGWGAFEDLRYLYNIEIPQSVTWIDAIAFDNTGWLRRKQAEDPLVVVNDILIDGIEFEGDILVLPAGLKGMPSQTFWGNNSFNEVVIQEGIPVLYSQTFSLVNNMEKVFIPKSVTKIEEDAFEYISGRVQNIYYAGTMEEWENVEKSSNDFAILFSQMHYNATPEDMIFDGEEVIRPSSVERIKAEAFMGDKFSFVYLPDGSKYVEKDAFKDCPELKCIHIPESVMSIGNLDERVIICGKKGSYAERFAKENKNMFVEE